jgi:predicted aspartyl protease
MRGRAFKFAAAILYVAMLNGCASQPAAQSAAVPQSLERTLESQGYIALPLRRLRIGVETVSLRINGKTGLFVLDTGASLTIIDRSRLGKFNIAQNAPLSSTNAIGAGGSVVVSSYPVRSIGFGSNEFDIKRISSADMSAVNASFTKDTGLSVDGVLGHDVLSHFGAVIDLGQGRLFLRRP